MWAKAAEALAAVEMEEAMAWRRAVGRVGGGSVVWCRPPWRVGP